MRTIGLPIAALLSGLFLIGCVPADTPMNIAAASSFKEMVRQETLQNEPEIGINLDAFPGMLDCIVNANVETFTPNEMQTLDAFAHNPIYGNYQAVQKILAARDRRIGMSSDQYVTQKCREILPVVGAYSGADELYKSQLQAILKPAFDKHRLNTDLRNETVDCTWKMIEANITPAEMADLDAYAKGRSAIPDRTWRNVEERLDAIAKGDEDFSSLQKYCPDTVKKVQARS